jgi:hypothetical protein
MDLVEKCTMLTGESALNVRIAQTLSSHYTGPYRAPRIPVVFELVQDA